MKSIAISKWIGYCPFREAEQALEGLGVRLEDGVHDRIEGLIDGRYDAAPMSTYELVEALPRLGDEFGVGWIAVEPVDCGSDRVICRPKIVDAGQLHAAKIGVRETGLERLYFEHIFSEAELAPKQDYIYLGDCDAYEAKFICGEIEAVMAPQPLRSQLLKAVPDAVVFDGDGSLPRYGFRAPLVYSLTSWNGSELQACQEVFLKAASHLRRYDNLEIRQTHPSSTAGIPLPAKEIRETLRWPSAAESSRYLASEDSNSFRSDMEKIARLVLERVSGARKKDMMKLVSSYSDLPP